MKLQLPFSWESLPTIPKEIKNIHDFNTALHAAVTAPEPLVEFTLRRLIARNPGATVAELIEDASSRYRKRIAIESSAVGMSAAIPTIGTVTAAGLTVAELGTFFAETTLYVLVVTRLYGITVTDVEQRKTLVLSSLLGQDADKIMAQELGLSSLAWARSAITAGSKANFNRINQWLLNKLAKRAVKKQTGKLLGRFIPFGVGAAIGWFSGRHLASQVIDGLAASLGTPPDTLPPGLRIIEGTASDVRNDVIDPWSDQAIERSRQTLASQTEHLQEQAAARKDSK